MPSRFDDHAQAIANGVLEAWRIYGGWSQNFQVHDEGIEAFLSVKVAETLHARFADVCRVRLEAPVERLKEASGCILTPGRYPLALRRAGRVDVAFSDRKGRPVGAVEVKRHLQASGLRPDLMRLCAMLGRFGAGNGGSMRWAALAAMHTVWASNRDDTSARLERAAATLRAHAPGFRIKPFAAEDWLRPPIEHDDNVLHGAAGLCLLITPQGAKTSPTARLDGKTGSEPSFTAGQLFSTALSATARLPSTIARNASDVSGAS